MGAGRQAYGRHRRQSCLPWANSTRDDRGAAAVEFALICVPLFLLLFGIIQVSILLWAHQAGSHAAGEGARRYSVEPCGNFTTLVRSRLGGATTSASGTTVGTSFSASPKKVGDTVTVTVDFPVARISALIPGVPSRMKSSSTARIEDVTGC